MIRNQSIVNTQQSTDTTAILIGLTGGIGSGKSTVARVLSQMGFPVYDSDKEAQRIMHDNPCVRSQIELLFGSDIYVDDRLDRKQVARMVFSNPESLQKLNSIVHPAVMFDLKQWMKKDRTEYPNPSPLTSRLSFVESAILFQSNLDKLCTKTICITAPLETRIQRTILRDHTSREQVVSRINSQMPQEELISHSDFCVENDGSKEISKICLEILNFCSNFAV